MSTSPPAASPGLLRGRTAGRPLRLLCVEDNDADYRLLMEHLREASFQMPVELCRAKRLAEALTILGAEDESVAVDVVLLDLSLPDSSGIETFEAVHKASPSTAVTVLSGSSDDELALNMVQRGAQDYLPKDALNADMLRRSVTYAIERHRMRSGLRRLNEQLLAAQSDLKTMQMQLIQAEKLDSLGRIAASVAHEVKNPLATLQMGTDYFDSQREALGPVGGAMVTCMQEAISRAERIIHEMLDFSRSEHIQVQPCRVNDVTSGALRMILPELLERRVSVQESYDSTNPVIQVDHRKLEQVLINLLINAAQAMPDGGVIQVRTAACIATGIAYDAGLREMDLLKEGDDAVIIEIRDHGTGIPPDLMGRIFEPFFTTKPTGEGTGLGLPVCKRIVELHRGHLAVSNAAEPPGVIVRVTLKAGDARPAG